MVRDLHPSALWHVRRTHIEKISGVLDVAKRRPKRPLHCLVYARHGHELRGASPLLMDHYTIIYLMIYEQLVKGKGKIARFCLEEAWSKAASRRTETPYKAEPVDELAQDNEVRLIRQVR